MCGVSIQFFLYVILVILSMSIKIIIYPLFEKNCNETKTTREIAPRENVFYSLYNIKNTNGLHIKNAN